MIRTDVCGAAANGPEVRLLLHTVLDLLLHTVLDDSREMVSKDNGDDTVRVILREVTSGPGVASC